MRAVSLFSSGAGFPFKAKAITLILKYIFIMVLTSAY